MIDCEHKSFSASLFLSPFPLSLCRSNVWHIQEKTWYVFFFPHMEMIRTVTGAGWSLLTEIVSCVRPADTSGKNYNYFGPNAIPEA